MMTETSPRTPRTSKAPGDSTASHVDFEVAMGGASCHGTFIDSLAKMVSVHSYVPLPEAIVKNIILDALGVAPVCMW